VLFWFQKNSPKLGIIFSSKNKIAPGERVRRIVLMADEKYKDWTGEKATFGMSWFWFPEGLFGAAPGVIRTRVGFAGGSSKDPVYCKMDDHTETVDVEFDPNVTTYDEMLKYFWANHNSTSNCSRQYMSAIFYQSPEQKSKAEDSMKAEQERLGSSRIIQTKILPAREFYLAEDYHQKYLLQRHSHLLEELDIEPGPELVHSHVATRLNGYLGGYGTLDDFENECKELYLPESVEEFVKRQFAKRKTTKG